MLIPISELGLIKGDSVEPGTLVLPIRGDSSHDSALAIVVDGGDFRPGRMLLPLGGEEAFVPRDLKVGQAVVLADRKLLLRITDLDSAVPDKYLPGQIAVDEDAGYMILRFKYAMQELVYLLSLSTWRIEKSFLKDTAFWPANWELVARSHSLKDDFIAATYPPTGVE